MDWDNGEMIPHSSGEYCSHNEVCEILAERDEYIALLESRRRDAVMDALQALIYKAAASGQAPARVIANAIENNKVPGVTMS